MIESIVLEDNIKIKQQHERLREMAREQGVKPVRKIKDLYVATEKFDVDEFLATVRELRQNDRVKDNE